MPASQKQISALTRATMVLRGITWRDLAKLTGLRETTLKQIVTGGNRSAITRRKVEAALQWPIWTNSLDFAGRLPMIRHFGADPLTMKRADLCRHLRQYVPAEAALPIAKPELIQLLENHFTEQQKGAVA